MPIEFTDEQLEGYARNLALPGWGMEAQQKAVRQIYEEYLATVRIEAHVVGYELLTPQQFLHDRVASVPDGQLVPVANLRPHVVGLLGDRGERRQGVDTRQYGRGFL